MRVRCNRRWTFVLPAVLTLAGCASIVSGRRSDVAFNTNPPNAHIAVIDRRGQPVASLDGPGTVNLKRQGRFFMPARYTAIISAPGYQTAQVPIGSTVNPWILGNVILGGIPGIVIDSATGAAWKPKRSEVNLNLMPLDGPEYSPAYSSDEPRPAPWAGEVPHTADASSTPSTTQPSRR